MSLTQKENILILGGTGFIGLNLTEFLVDKKNVIIFCRNNPQKKLITSIKDKVKIITGDINDAKKVEEIFQLNKIDTVIHLISSLTPSSPTDLAINNLEINSTIKLLEIMNKYEVKKILFMSSGGTVYGTNGNMIQNEKSPLMPINFYGFSKMTIENYIQYFHRINGMQYIIIRASNIYGKYHNPLSEQGIIPIIIRKVIQNEIVEIWGDGEIIRDYLYAEDLCRAISLLIDNNKWNKIYNIGSGQGTSINELIKIIKKNFNHNFKVEYRKSRKVDVPSNILDISQLKHDISWGEILKLEEGIRLTKKNIENQYNC